MTFLWQEWFSCDRNDFPILLRFHPTISSVSFFIWHLPANVTFKRVLLIRFPARFSTFPEGYTRGENYTLLSRMGLQVEEEENNLILSWTLKVFILAFIKFLPMACRAVNKGHLGAWNFSLLKIWPISIQCWLLGLYFIFNILNSQILLEVDMLFW